MPNSKVKEICKNMQPRKFTHEMAQMIRDLDETPEKRREAITAELQQAFAEASASQIEELCALEVEHLCGAPHSRKKDPHAPRRGGSDAVTIPVAGQRVAFKKARVKQANREVPLKTVELAKSTEIISNMIMKKMINGMSCRKYQKSLQDVAGSLGLSAATVSRRFQEGSTNAVAQMNERDLTEDDYIAVFLDTVYFAGHALVFALGVTVEGEKKWLGIVEGETENTEVVKTLLENLSQRGLDKEKHRLYIVDGAPALKKAIKEVFADKAHIQRCTLHKKRNVLKALEVDAKDPQYEDFLKKFSGMWYSVFRCESLQKAQEKMDKIEIWLSEQKSSGEQELSEEQKFSEEKIEKALSSLKEGRDEMFTLVELGIPPFCRKYFLTTNLLENGVSDMRDRSRRVKNWQGENQRVRWAACMGLEAEENFSPIKGGSMIPQAIREHLDARAKQHDRRACEAAA